MKSWPDFETRFRGLAPRLQYARLDDQTGAAGEYWRIAGGFDRVAGREFETLSLLAGSLLTQALSYNPKFEQILADDDPRIRWYRTLKEFSGTHSPGPPAYQSDDKGENLGWIFAGSINSNIAEVAANVCLYLHAHFPIKMPWYENVSGPHSSQYPVELAHGKRASFLVSLKHTPEWTTEFCTKFVESVDDRYLNTLMAQIHTSVGKTIEVKVEKGLIDLIKKSQADA